MLRRYCQRGLAFRRSATQALPSQSEMPAWAQSARLREGIDCRPKAPPPSGRSSTKVPSAARPACCCPQRIAATLRPIVNRRPTARSRPASGLTWVASPAFAAADTTQAWKQLLQLQRPGRPSLNLAVRSQTTDFVSSRLESKPVDHLPLEMALELALDPASLELEADHRISPRQALRGRLSRGIPRRAPSVREHFRDRTA